MAQHGELGEAGGAGSGGEDGDVLASARRHLLIEPAGMLLLEPPPHLRDGGELQQVGKVVELQTSGVVVDELLYAAETIPQLDQLVGLFLVLRHHHPHPGVGEDVDDLLADGGGIDAHSGASDRLNRQLGDEPFRAVVAQHRHHLASLHAESRQPVGEGPYPLVVLPPRDRLPDPVALLLEGDALITPRRGPRRQDLRHRARLAGRRDAARGRHPCSSPR